MANIITSINIYIIHITWGISLPWLVIRWHVRLVAANRTQPTLSLNRPTNEYTQKKKRTRERMKMGLPHTIHSTAVWPPSFSLMQTPFTILLSRPFSRSHRSASTRATNATFLGKVGWKYKRPCSPTLEWKFSFRKTNQMVAAIIRKPCSINGSFQFITRY